MKSQPINILFLSSWSYAEPLMHSYLLPNLRLVKGLLPEGSICYLQTFEKKNFEINEKEKQNIIVQLKKEGIIWTPLFYSKFGIKAAIIYPVQILKLVRLCKRENIEILHPFAPVAGFLALLIRKMHSSLIVLDSWEPHAESMVETSVWKRNSIAFRLLWNAERRLTKTANVLLAASPKMIDYALEKWNLNPRHVYHRPACVDVEHFVIDELQKNELRKQLGWENAIVIVCASKLGGLYMRDEVFEFFKSGLDIFGNRFKILFLSQASVDEVDNLSRKVGIPAESIKHLHVPYDSIPKYLQIGDFAFNPQRHVPSKRYGTPVKDGEYWAMGLPLVIMPDISEDSEIVISEKVGVILESTTVADMQMAMISMKNLLESDNQLRMRCRYVATKYRSYEIAKLAYKSAFEYLMTIRKSG